MTYYICPNLQCEVCIISLKRKIETFDRRLPLMENCNWWRTTCDDRLLLIEDYHWWKTTLDLRQPAIIDIDKYFKIKNYEYAIYPFLLIQIGKHIRMGYRIMLGFSPRTHKLCFQEILKLTGNLKKYEQNFKNTRWILCVKNMLKVYKCKIFAIQLNLEKFQWWNRLFILYISQKMWLILPRFTGSLEKIPPCIGFCGSYGGASETP